MTHVASLKNCKRLYELSGWEAERQHYIIHKYTDHTKRSEPTGIPAYDAGYLLRKLPHYVETDDSDWRWNWEMDIRDNGKFRINYDGRNFVATADTPEDALCLLAIKLFEKGILKI